MIVLEFQAIMFLDCMIVRILPYVRLIVKQMIYPSVIGIGVTLGMDHLAVVLCLIIVYGLKVMVWVCFLSMNAGGFDSRVVPRRMSSGKKG